MNVYLRDKEIKEVKPDCSGGLHPEIKKSCAGHIKRFVNLQKKVVFSTTTLLL